MSEVGAIEVVHEAAEAVPVLAPKPVRRWGLIRSVAPATQAMMVAASGFLAGATVVGLVARRRGHAARGPAGRRGTRKAGGGNGTVVNIVGTRSLLLDVHLLGAPER